MGNPKLASWAHNRARLGLGQLGALTGLAVGSATRNAFLGAEVAIGVNLVAQAFQDRFIDQPAMSEEIREQVRAQIDQQMDALRSDDYSNYQAIEKGPANQSNAKDAQAIDVAAPSAEAPSPDYKPSVRADSSSLQGSEFERNTSNTAPTVESASGANEPVGTDVVASDDNPEASTNDEVASLVAESPTEDAVSPIEGDQVEQETQVEEEIQEGDEEFAPSEAELPTEEGMPSLNDAPQPEEDAPSIKDVPSFQESEPASSVSGTTTDVESDPEADEAADADYIPSTDDTVVSADSEPGPSTEETPAEGDAPPMDDAPPPEEDSPPPVDDAPPKEDLPPPTGDAPPSNTPDTTTRVHPSV